MHMLLMNMYHVLKEIYNICCPLPIDPTAPPWATAAAMGPGWGKVWW